MTLGALRVSLGVDATGLKTAQRELAQFVRAAEAKSSCPSVAIR